MVGWVKSAVEDLRFGVSQGSTCPEPDALSVVHVTPLGDIIKRHNLDFNFNADDAQLYLAFKANAAEQTGSIDLIACKRMLVG